MFIKSIRISYIAVLMSGGFLACSSGTNWTFGLENTGPPGDLPVPVAVVPTTVPSDYIPTEGYSDSFTQPAASDKVDIIWMIDNSGSMGNNQQAIADNAAKFTSKLETAGVDFQLMVVSADPDHPLAELPDGCSKHVITNANADQFTPCAMIGTNSDGEEEGLETVHRAIVQNPTFLRADADLQVVYVSDEEDEPEWSTWKPYASAPDYATLGQELAGWANEPPAVLSSSAHGEPTSHLADEGRNWSSAYTYTPIIANHIAFLKSLKTAPHKVRTHAIVTGGGTDPFLGLNGSDECHTRGNYEEIGKRYLMVVNDSEIGGSHTDLCADWSPTMDQLGLLATGQELCFSLKHIPISITSVKADGGTIAYTYQKDGNKVCPTTLLNPGQVLVVTYTY